ncbi:MAG: hypothetical protein HDR81_02975 [Bacteroides sp.]|nr:hypothetical protein [Bacteroides sp.]
MGTPSLESNPLFPTTTIFIGNGFDLSLGLKSRYIDYFNHTDDNGKKIFGQYTTLSPRKNIYNSHRVSSWSLILLPCR